MTIIVTRQHTEQYQQYHLDLSFRIHIERELFGIETLIVVSLFSGMLAS